VQINVNGSNSLVENVNGTFDNRKQVEYYCTNCFKISVKVELVLWSARFVRLHSRICCNAGWIWKRKTGYRMINKVSSTVHVGHRLYCLANCTMSPICDSCNYRPSDRTCQFNTDLWLVQLPSFWQDVPVQHSRHSAHRHLDRHYRRQRLELVQHHLHRRRLNDTR